MSTPTTTKMVPWKSIYVPEDANARLDLPKIKEMADSLKEHGQFTPILVSNGGDGDKPYTLRAGARRMAAWKLNGWQNRDIEVKVREYKKGDVVSPVIEGLVENIDREDLPQLDLALKIHQLVHGTYAVGEGEEPIAVEKKVLSDRLGIGLGTINNYIRVIDSLSPDVVKLSRKHGAPMRLMVLWAGIEGKGRTDEARAEDKAAKQLAGFEEWLAAKTQLEAEGRKKKPRKAKTTSKGEDADGEGSASMVNKTKTDLLEAHIQVLKAKLDDEDVDGEQELLIKGRIEALRFVTGDLKKLPGVTKSDLDALQAEEEEEVEETDEE